MTEPTILVCDDDEPLRELMKVTLGEGYRFVEADEGEIALAALAPARQDNMLSAVMHPGHSGLDVLR
jgi:CheY-like chemotaxis protein